MVHLNRFLPLFILTGLLFGQDGLILKSGKVYNGTFIRNVDELIVFQVEGENHFTPFPINDVDIVITSRGGVKVELYYPFDIPTKQEYHPKSSYEKLPDEIIIVLKAAACSISIIWFMRYAEQNSVGM